MAGKIPTLPDSLRGQVPVLVAAAAIILAFFFAGQILSRTKPIVTSGGAVIDLDAYWRDCVTGVLRDGRGPAACSSAASVRKAYNVDARLVIDEELSRAIMTARRLDRREITDEETYQRCVRERACVDLPGIRRGMSEAEAREVRELHEHLVRSGRLTPAVCALLETCRAALKTGLLRPERLARP